ncbi:MAG: recombination protein RecR [Muribaculaceae bacterium]|nr:recombination protein RecR [Muribaculaceae bacterium]
MHEEFASNLLETAVTELSRLPGVGRKTALRLALHLLRRDESQSVALGEAIIDLRRNIRYCRQCHNISETDLCAVCSSPTRQQSTVCVVENVSDVMAIERTRQYQGVYHVLGGVISPMDGIGPDMIEIESLVERVASGSVEEVILALPATMEGDTTNFYIYRKLSAYPEVKITQLARGVAIGNELEYTDEVTLGRSLIHRTLFSESFTQR